MSYGAVAHAREVCYIVYIPINCMLRYYVHSKIGAT